MNQNGNASLSIKCKVFPGEAIRNSMKGDQFSFFNKNWFVILFSFTTQTLEIKYRESVSEVSPKGSSMYFTRSIYLN